ncbi:MAG: hypothetical protein ACRD1C_03130 [Terriglobales bacterium]
MLSRAPCTGPSNEFIGGGVIARGATFITANSTSTWTTLNNNTRVYVGLAFTRGNNTYYGWAQVEASLAASNNASVTTELLG